MAPTTKVTSSVIEANNVLSRHIANAQIETRHYANASILQQHLSGDLSLSANTLVVTDLTVSNSAHISNVFVVESGKINVTYGVGYGNALVGFNYAESNVLWQAGVTQSNVYVIYTDPSWTAANNKIVIGQNGVLIGRTDLILPSGVRFYVAGNANVTGNLIVATSPSSGNQVGNRDFNDLRYYANDHVTLLSAYANDYNTYTSISGNASASADLVQSNLTALISGATPFTSLKTFNDDVVIAGNLTVLGDAFTANVGNITTEDNTIIVNWNGSDATAAGAGVEVAGTSNALLANIRYNTSSLSNFRIGTGTLTAADDIARTQDYQANDTITFNAAKANDYATYTAGISAASANDYATFLAANANDYATLLSAYANDFATWNSAKANDFNTFTSLTANLNSLSSNVSALGGTTLTPKHNVNTSTGTSNVFFFRAAANTIGVIDRSFVYVDGVFQPRTGYLYHSANDTIQFTDAVIPASLTINITGWVFP